MSSLPPAVAKQRGWGLWSRGSVGERGRLECPRSSFSQWEPASEGPLPHLLPRRHREEQSQIEFTRLSQENCGEEAGFLRLTAGPNLKFPPRISIKVRFTRRLGLQWAEAGGRDKRRLRDFAEAYDYTHRWVNKQGTEFDRGKPPLALFLLTPLLPERQLSAVPDVPRSTFPLSRSPSREPRAL
ncbi:hypothetical protein SKAU_G00082010 [Synaphobranchus kaupii]|uniref:Uncharacterized protein n=1 Tax=Synaphobranchus kaupii TaxID=118154 RepID=A0A9Q1FVU1_SYNKA|nr:hypothetical protein SKAU_G00082010 [Synaphobranchus kaupii]